MKTNPTLITKSHLLDYVTKVEFNDFRDEMKDFRVDTQNRFTSIDNRLDSLDRKVDSIREEFRVHTGVLLQQSREEFKTAMEYMRHVEAKKLDKEEFEALELRIQHLIG